jgi:hypothetical protein
MTQQILNGSYTLFPVDLSKFRICVKCKEYRPKEYYNVDKTRGKDGLNTKCRKCRTKEKKIVRKLKRENPNPDKICSITGNSGVEGLVTDHDHETGEYRGDIPDNFNTGIGLLGDTIKDCFLATRYLGKPYMEDPYFRNLINELGRYIDNEIGKSNRTTTSTN